jgi:hypothetical protein
VTEIGSTVTHRIVCSASNVTAVRARVEHKLGVETEAVTDGRAWPEWPDWVVYFDADPLIDLDFLRPDVLPPLVDDDA